jgi:hypothetical protein
LSGNSQREVNMQIELNDEHLDLAFAKLLTETIDNLTTSTKCLKKIKNPDPYILEDIDENEKVAANKYDSRKVKYIYRHLKKRGYKMVFLKEKSKTKLTV